MSSQDVRGWLPTGQNTRALGAALAPLLRPADLLVLAGDLGAGKTTFVQGLGEGLGVRGPITSPTFVIARVHPSLVDGPALIHADAYRLSGLDELDDLDLPTPMEEAVLVVEWGVGMAEGLADDCLTVHLSRSSDPADERREVTLTATGGRWTGPLWRQLFEAARPTFA